MMLPHHKTLVLVKIKKTSYFIVSNNKITPFLPPNSMIGFIELKLQIQIHRALLKCQSLQFDSIQKNTLNTFFFFSFSPINQNLCSEAHL